MVIYLATVCIFVWIQENEWKCYFRHTVPPPVSDHPKFKDWSLTGGGRRLQESNRKGVASEKRSWHIYFIEDNLLRECLS